VATDGDTFPDKARRQIDCVRMVSIATVVAMTRVSADG
jgi:hypothetical protein